MCMLRQLLANGNLRRTAVCIGELGYIYGELQEVMSKQFAVRALGEEDRSLRTRAVLDPLALPFGHSVVKLRLSTFVDVVNLR